MSDRDPLADRLRAWEERGHEVSLHGWEHRQPGVVRTMDRIVTRGAGEFARLDELASRSRLEAGLGVLAVNGLATNGFTPPGWVISKDAARVLKPLGIAYYTTQLAIHDLHNGRKLRVPAVCHRPGTPLARSAARVMRVGHQLARRIGHDLRMAIHPDDTGDAHLVEASLSVLRTAAYSGTRIVPYATYLEAT